MSLFCTDTEDAHGIVSGNGRLQGKGNVYVSACPLVCVSDIRSVPLLGNRRDHTVTFPSASVV